MDNARAFHLSLWVMLAGPFAMSIFDLVKTIQGDKQRDSQPQPPTTEKSRSQVSGGTLFWALLTITLYAMAQHSVAGHWMSGSTFDKVLWPHRSSPMVCVADTAVSINDFIKARRSSQERQQRRMQEAASNGYQARENRRVDRNSAAFLLNVVIFLVGVLPQAIVVFSMRGIMRTQYLAATFLISSSWSLVRSSPSFHNDDKSEHERLILKLDIIRRENVSAPTAASLDILSLVWLLHAVMLCGSWDTIAGAITIPVPDVLREVITKIQVLCCCISWIIALQEVVRRPAQLVPRVRDNKTWLLVFIPWLLAAILDLFMPASKKSAPFRGLPLLLVCTLACFGFTLALTRSLGWMYNHATNIRDVPSDATGSSPVSGQATIDGDQQSTGHITLLRSQDMDGDIGMQSLDGGRRDAEDVSDGHVNTSLYVQLGADVEPESTATEAETHVAGDRAQESLFSSRLASEILEASRQEEQYIVRLASLLAGCVKDVGTALFRSMIGFTELYVFGPGSLILMLFLRHHVEAWIAFAILNLGTAAVYYFLAFDGKGTWAPSWGQVLG